MSDGLLSKTKKLMKRMLLLTPNSGVKLRTKQSMELTHSLSIM